VAAAVAVAIAAATVVVAAVAAVTDPKPPAAWFAEQATRSTGRKSARSSERSAGYHPELRVGLIENIEGPIVLRRVDPNIPTPPIINPTFNPAVRSQHVGRPVFLSSALICRTLSEGRTLDDLGDPQVRLHRRASLFYSAVRN
jgi:hypothetical protein